ncbi:hypothetical protein D3C72_1822270 [compost metagenome]
MGTNIPRLVQLRRLFTFFLPFVESFPPSLDIFIGKQNPCYVTSMLNGVIFRNSLLKIGDKEFDNKGVIFYLDGQIHFT